MRHIIRSDEAMTFNLCDNDRTSSILQNLYLLITTREGTVPMYRKFGLRQDFMDKPIPVAQTMMISEVREKMEEFEPRASFVDLSFGYTENQPGNMVVVLEVEI